MSFKFLISFFLLTILFGCGVKSDPIPPSDTFLPSVESHYMDKIEGEKEKDETEEKDKKKTDANEKVKAD